MTTPGSRSSLLFTATVTGLPLLRSTSATKRSAASRPALAVDQEDDSVGLLDGARGLPGHELVHAARRLDEPAGVDDDEMVRLVRAP